MRMKKGRESTKCVTWLKRFKGELWMQMEKMLPKRRNGWRLASQCGCRIYTRLFSRIRYCCFWVLSLSWSFSSLFFLYPSLFLFSVFCSSGLVTCSLEVHGWKLMPKASDWEWPSRDILVRLLHILFLVHFFFLLLSHLEPSQVWALTLSVCLFPISPAFCLFLFFISAYSVCRILMCLYLFTLASLSFTLGMCMLFALGVSRDQVMWR